MNHERIVAGLSCGQVLAGLSDYMDGELPHGQREQVEAHVRGCELCARFGGVFAATVRGLRLRLGAAEDVPADVARRLDAALRLHGREGGPA